MELLLKSAYLDIHRPTANNTNLQILTQHPTSSLIQKANCLSHNGPINIHPIR